MRKILYIFLLFSGLISGQDLIVSDSYNGFSTGISNYYTFVTNDYMTTTADPSGLVGSTIVIRGRVATGVSGYTTLLSYTTGGVGGEISFNSDANYFRMGTSSGNIVMSADWTNDGAIHTWVIQYKGGGNAEWWLDGVSQATVTGGATIDMTEVTVINIGRWAASQYLDGDLYAVCYYTDQLTAGEIADVSANITTAPSDNALLRLLGDKLSGTWNDESGNSNNATNNGATLN